MDSSFNLAVHALVCLSHSGRSLSSEALAENICTNPTRVRRVMAGLKKAGMVETREGLDGDYTSLVAHDMASGALAPRKPKYGDPDYYTYNEGESL